MIVDNFTNFENNKEWHVNDLKNIIIDEIVKKNGNKKRKWKRFWFCHTTESVTRSAVRMISIFYLQLTLL